MKSRFLLSSLNKGLLLQLYYCNSKLIADCQLHDDESSSKYLLFFAVTAVSGFQIAPNGPASRIVAESSTLIGPKSFQLFTSSPTSESETSDSATESNNVQGILDEFHASNLPFRIVVIGNGAILETTSKLGRKCL